MSQRVIDRHKAGLDALEQRSAPIFAIDFGQTDQPDTVSQRLCLRDIGGDDLADAANVDAVKIDFGTEAERGTYR